MKKAIIAITIILILFFVGCNNREKPQLAATTLPVYEFTNILCEGTGISVSRLITENVSCLHDYTLQVSQMRILESAEAVIISGAGLEDFLEDALYGANHIIDASSAVVPVEHHDHDHDDHHHNSDPHIWLSPENAKVMSETICTRLSELFPEHQIRFEENLSILFEKLDGLQAYGEETLQTLSCRDLITFHDGFSYFASCFDLKILKAVEEESGSEASAKELIELIQLVNSHNLPAIFTETNGSTSAAEVIAAETGVPVFSLDMAMAGDSYFESMYHNIDTVKEALG